MRFIFSDQGVKCIHRPGQCIVAFIAFVLRLSNGSNLDTFPTVGPSSLIESWLGRSKSFGKLTDVIQQGYEKYKSAPFKVAAGYWWMVVLGSREHMDELRKAPDDMLSFHKASDDVGKTKYTLGDGFADSGNHVGIVISQLTRNIAGLYQEIRDEISVAFDEVLDLKDHEWKSAFALSVVEQVVCRTSNRLFIGLPLCRDPDWLNINLVHKADVDNTGRILQCFPNFLSPLVARFLTKVRKTRERATRCLAPVIEERIKLLEMHGKDWDGKPNDMLTWLLDLEKTDGPQHLVRLVAHRIMSINFAAIHTSSFTFTQTLFFLAANPQYIQPLREEVETIVQTEGWSKASLGKMRKIDSFLKECQRLTGIALVGLLRKALNDYTFSDGTFIPKGTLIIAPAHSLHLDNANYPNAQAFDPFRFSDMRQEDGEGTKHQYVSTSLEYLSFGHGKHACPGRFFAANELKSMLAHIVVTYDVKLEDPQTPPEKLMSERDFAPDPAAKVMFRKRVH